MPDLAIASPTAPPFDPGAALAATRQKPAAPKPDPVAAALPSAAPPPAAGDDALRAAREAMDEFHKAAPQPRQSDPAEAWGSMAMAVAALGGLLTHTPLTTAFNAMGGVLNAYKQNDQAKAQQEFEHWKVAHEAAGKLADMEMKAYGEILKSTDPHRQLAALQAQAAAFKNQAILDATNRGDHEEAMRLITGHANAVSGMQKIEMLQDPSKDNQLYLMRSSKDGTVTFTTPDGQPYTPGGATKVGTGAKEGSSTAIQKNVEDDLKKIHPDWSPGQVSQEAKQQIAAGTTQATTQARLRAQAEEPPFTPEQAHTLAMASLVTGQQMVSSRLGAGALRQVLAEEANIVQGSGHTVQEYLSGQAQFKADAASLRALTIRTDALDAAAKATRDEFTKVVIPSIPKTPEPLNMQFLTRWVRTGEKQFGDADVPVFTAALISGLDEYAKVLAGATGAAGSTDASRAQAASIIPEGATSDQIPGIVYRAILPTIDIKIEDYQHQKDAITTRMANAGPAGGRSSEPTRNYPPVVPEAAQQLRKDPRLAPQFDEIFGPGASEKVLRDRQ